MYNYYQNRLNGDQKITYETVLSGLQKYEYKIQVAKGSNDEINKVVNYVQLDNPMIFYMGAFSFSGGGNGYFISPEYKYPKQFSTEKAEAIKQYLRIFDGLKAQNDYIKETYIHDYCIDNFTYDFKRSEHSFSVLGPILNKTAVCEGIAKFVKLAFDYVGLRCLVVKGTAINPMSGNQEPHAWNIVTINGNTFHLDVTFDISISNIDATHKAKRYDYFNLPDVDIKKDHITNDNVPACTTLGKDYFSFNSLAMKTLADFEAYMEKAAKQGKKNILVKMLNMQDVQGTINKIMEITQSKYIGNVNGFELKPNPSQMVFEIIVK